MSKMQDIFWFISIFILVATLFVVTFEFGSSWGEYDLTQSLCKKQKYDFCEIVNIEYKLKEQDND